MFGNWADPAFHHLVLKSSMVSVGPIIHQSLAAIYSTVTCAMPWQLLFMINLLKGAL